MHQEVLSEEQKKLLPLIAHFENDFYLAGGTAIALYLGHRSSIDFDLFSDKRLKRQSIKNYLKSINKDYRMLYDAYDQMHILTNGVKITFFNFPFKIDHKQIFNGIITLPSLLDLAAMKAFAFGGRAKWKDYVDMYFLLNKGLKIKEITDRAKQYFQDAFNAKLFHQQLAYFEDMDYSEKVHFFGEVPSDEEIRTFLAERAITEF